MYSFIYHLSCLNRYTDGDGLSSTASILIKVTYSKFPTRMVDVGEYHLGTDAVLEVEFEMYPEPKNSAFVWIINEDEDDEVRVFPSGE